jgi:Tol biopolymer transport system component
MTAQAARTLRPQDEISHYRIVGPLGAGGMGEVYLAQDESLERNVALKVLPPDLVRSEERVRRFVLEAKSASSLNHPNIVTIYEIGQDAVRSAGQAESAPVHFISMELVSGKTLSVLIHEDKTDLRTLLGYLAQVAEGLAKAHAAGIVHRDLKPGNIMVSGDGFAKVLDFGLAKLTERGPFGPEMSTAPTAAPDATGEGVVVGTAGYMAPEQVEGKAVDHRSDVFSFGCILYEAATRRRAFAADTAVETMHQILRDRPMPVEEINAKVPAELRRLIRRCLAKNPEQRLQSMKDLALELREIVDEFDSLSASASSGSLATGSVPLAPARRVPAWVWIGGALAVVTIAGVAWWALSRPRPRGQPFQSMRMSTQTSLGDVLDCVISPDGRYLAYLAGSAGRATLRVRQVATGSDVEVLPPTEGLRSPAFSPDGSYIYYLAVKPDARSYNTLFQVPSLGGTPVERTFDVDSRVSFSPDGRRIAFWRGVPQEKESRVVLFDLGSGRERILTSVPLSDFPQGSPDWSPDGKQLAALVVSLGANARTTITLVDAGTGRHHDYMVLDRTPITDIAWLRDGSGLVAAGVDLKSSISPQLFLIGYPKPGIERLTNDFSQYRSVSTSAGDEAVAAVRKTQLANLWVAVATGAPARQITSVTNPENYPFSLAIADTGSVVYSAPRDQDLQIWSTPVAGGTPRALTSGTGLCFGSEGNAGVIVFNRLDASGFHVWRMDADGGGLRQLTSGTGEQFASLSRDARFSTLTRLDSIETCWLLAVESGQIRRLADNVRMDLGFSPDGQRVLLGTLETDEHGLIMTRWLSIPRDGGAGTASMVLPGSFANAAWSADGEGILFLDTADPAWNVYRQRFDGGSRTPVTHFTDGRVRFFGCSPDGRKLAIARRVGAATNVWVTDADGSHAVQVTQFAGEDLFQMEWLPDSRRLVVSAGTSSQDAVLIRNFR